MSRLFPSLLLVCFFLSAVGCDSSQNFSPTATVTATAVATTTPLPPTPAPTPRLSFFGAATPFTPAPRSPLNPLHGIHAPVGGVWDMLDQTVLDSFRDANGNVAGPGMAVALSTDMNSGVNVLGLRLEQTLRQYAARGSEVYVRMWPQRFPAGVVEPVFDNTVATISGTPDDAVADMLAFLRQEQDRVGWHATRIIPGNEMNVEWPDGTYRGQKLAWNSGNDPRKYAAINQFYLDLRVAWQARLAQEDAAQFRDVTLYFPAMAQDGNGRPIYAGLYFYDDKGVRGGNKYDMLRLAIEAYAHFTWHNYFLPGKAWEGRVIAQFPQWLKDDLARGTITGRITECGWEPDSLVTQTQDARINGVLFEDDLRYFLEQASGAAGE